MDKSIIEKLLTPEEFGRLPDGFFEQHAGHRDMLPFHVEKTLELKGPFPAHGMGVLLLRTIEYRPENNFSDAQIREFIDRYFPYVQKSIHRFILYPRILNIAVEAGISMNYLRLEDDWWEDRGIHYVSGDMEVIANQLPAEHRHEACGVCNWTWPFREFCRMTNFFEFGSHVVFGQHKLYSDIHNDIPKEDHPFVFEEKKLRKMLEAFKKIGMQLISLGADPNLTDPFDGESIASFILNEKTFTAEHVLMFKKLRLRFDQPIEDRESLRSSPLHWLCWDCGADEGKARKLNAILKDSDIDPDLVSPAGLKLIHCVMNPPSLSGLKVLLEYGSNPNHYTASTKNSNKQQPGESIYSLMLKHLNNTNADLVTAIIELLKQHNADFNIPFRKGEPQTVREKLTEEGLWPQNWL